MGRRSYSVSTEDLSLDPRTKCEKAGSGHIGACYPVLWGLEKEGSLGFGLSD